MQSINATEVQRHFGQWLEQSHREPISIVKHNREVAILVDASYFHALQKRYLEEKKARELSQNKEPEKGVPSQIASFLKDINSFGGMTPEEAKEFKAHSKTFREEFHL